MSQRESCLLWLKDLLDHLRDSRQQLEEAERPEAARILVDSMLRDLECCLRLCESLRARMPAPAVA
jgi:hypothetical protein